MFTTEEVTARTDFLHRIKSEIIIAKRERSQEFRNHADEISINHHFLKAGVQTAFHPASRMHNQITATHDRAPEREHAFIGSLRINRIRSAGV